MTKKTVKKVDVCITCGQAVNAAIIAKQLRKQGVPSLAKLLLMVSSKVPKQSKPKK